MGPVSAHCTGYREEPRHLITTVLCHELWHPLLSFFFLFSSHFLCHLARTPAFGTGAPALVLSLCIISLWFCDLVFLLYLLGCFLYCIFQAFYAVFHSCSHVFNFPELFSCYLIKKKKRHLLLVLWVRYFLFSLYVDILGEGLSSSCIMWFPPSGLMLRCLVVFASVFWVSSKV